MHAVYQFGAILALLCLAIGWLSFGPGLLVPRNEALTYELKVCLFIEPGFEF